MPRSTAASVQSMTGSGVASGPTSLGTVLVECRSLNGRGLSIKTRLHGDTQGLDAAVESALRGRLARGSVTVTLAITERSTGGATVVDQELAVQAAAELEELGRRIGKDVQLADVLSVPGVLTQTTRAPLRAVRELPADLAAVVNEAVDRLIADREREGAATVEALLAELDHIAAELAVVQEQAPRIVSTYREKLLARVNEFLDGRAPAMEPEAVIREVAVFADRVDVAEEMQRLQTHLARGRELLAEGGPQGRNLEFLVQEMLREVNTLGSKTPDADIAHRVVAMKSSIDKLKEQAANLV